MPNNNDPKYFRTHVGLDLSPDSLLSQNLELTVSNSFALVENRIDWTFSICNKVIPTVKGLKLHKVQFVKEKTVTNSFQAVKTNHKIEFFASIPSDTNDIGSNTTHSLNSAELIE